MWAPGHHPKRLGLIESAALRRCFLVLGIIMLLQPSTAGAVSQVSDAQDDYGYFYRGQLITLTASRRLVAVSEAAIAPFRAMVGRQQLQRDPLSDRGPLQASNLVLYRLPADQEIDFIPAMRSFASTTPEEVQPVFEQGQSLLIPSDEIIAGFTAPRDLEDARSYFASQGSQGIVNVRAHRGNAFILTVDNPSNGRVYQVSQFLAGLDEIDFAEPNHIIVPLGSPEVPAFQGLASPPPGGAGGGGGAAPAVPPAGPSVAGSWIELVTEGCESATLPTGWSTGRWDNTFVDANWSVTSLRSHAGSQSCYATGGGSAGVAPPGDYPDNAFSWLDSPMLNLATYEEVYIEFWFYAKYQDVIPCTVPDLGGVGIFDPSSGTTTFLNVMAVCYTGDLTADPTTDNGWRRALTRVPPSVRSDGVHVRLVFKSDNALAAEGLYVDEIRVVGTTDVDAQPLGNDTYGARHYEMKNTGQIAALGNDDNDMNVPEAWGLVSVSPTVVVAVIDDGVDLTHPDLNLVTGYDPDGTAGGGPRGNHGTAVAGNVGAIGDNSIGVMGTAPGVSIMPVWSGNTLSDAADAIDVAVLNGADILSNSWGWVGLPSADIEAAVMDALAAGTVVLFAVGNGPDRAPWTYEVAFPASLCGTTDVICVGASSPTDEHKGAASSDGSFTWGSSYLGDGPDVVAPSPWSYTTDIQGAAGYHDGSLIDPTDPNSADYTATFGGTSSATPKVAGIAALLLSANPNLTPSDVKRILRDTADDIDAPGVDDKTGAGRVNAYKAVDEALSSVSSNGPCCFGAGTAAMLLILPLGGSLLRRRMPRPDE